MSPRWRWGFGAGALAVLAGVLLWELGGGRSLREPRRLLPPLAADAGALVTPPGAPRAERSAPLPPGAAQPRVPTLALLSWRADYLAAQRGRLVSIWPLAEAGPPRQLKRSGVPLRGAWGRQALVGVVDQGLQLWQAPDFAPGLLVSLPQAHAVARTALSADGQVLAALLPQDGGAGDPDTVALWQVADGTLLGQLQLPEGRLLGASLSRDGQLLAVFGDAGGAALLKLLRLTRGGLEELLSWRSAADRTCYSAAFSPDSRLLALGAGRSLLLWDLQHRQPPSRAATGQAAQLFPPQLQQRAARRFPPAHGLAFSPDGRQLAVLHALGVRGAALWRIEAPGWPATVTLAPQAWIKPPAQGGTLRQLSWDRQARLWLATAGYSDVVRLWRRQGDRFGLARELTLR